MDASRGEELSDTTDPERGDLNAVASRASRGATLNLLANAAPPLVFWSTPDGFSLAGGGAARELHPPADESIEAVQRDVQGLFANISYDGPAQARPRLLGGMVFDRDRSPSPAWKRFHPAWFMVPEVSVSENPDEQWLTVTAPDGVDRSSLAAVTEEPDEPATTALPAIIDQYPEPDRREWIDQVRNVRTQIDQGSFEKVVLAHTRALTLKNNPSAVSLVRSLRATNPNCHVFLFQPDAETIFAGATPERLVSSRGTRMQTDALAGSTRRGEDPQADDRLSAALEESVKNEHEHNLVVESITSRLRKLGATVTSGGRTVRRLRAVQHLHTPISAVHPDSPHVLRIVDALHPTPAVGGLPREPAIRAIQEIEQFDRGWYAAPLGWIDKEGDGDFALGIRSALFSGSTARLYAGAGIVADSDPEEEWEELQLKYRPVLDAFGDS